MASIDKACQAAVCSPACLPRQHDQQNKLTAINKTNFFGQDLQIVLLPSEQISIGLPQLILVRGKTVQAGHVGYTLPHTYSYTIKSQVYKTP